MRFSIKNESLFARLLITIYTLQKYMGIVKTKMYNTYRNVGNYNTYVKYAFNYTYTIK